MSKKQITSNDYSTVITNLLKVYPNLFSTEDIQRFAQNNILDFETASDLMNVVGSREAFQSNESVEVQNMLEGAGSIKYNSEILKSLGIQKVRVDTALQLAEQRKDNRLVTIRDLTQELDQITKQVINDHDFVSDCVLDDLCALVDDAEQANFIRNIRKTKVRSIADSGYGNSGEDQTATRKK